MSKGSSMVGEVYAKVIKDVCEQSRTDFEEGGVDLGTLEVLKAEWQRKLSQLKVTQLPWDPTPAPKQETASANVKPPPPTLPSNGTATGTPPSSYSTSNNVPQMKHEGVKHENMPSNNPVGPVYNAQQYPAMNASSEARARAAANLQQQYGVRAGPQIAQLQTGQAGVHYPPQTSQYIKQEKQEPDMPEYKPSPVEASSSPLKSSQNDGAGDAVDEWNAEKASRREMIARHRDAGDRLMREHFNLGQQELEAGGLLLPIAAHHTTNNRTKATIDSLSTITSALDRPSAGLSTSSLAHAQGDAAGDDDGDVDEDAINSDLDDPDELANIEEQNEAIDQVMLCTYDKVQRVKNKWKCTLKDGVLRVEGTEHVFHKGQGEFEW